MDDDEEERDFSKQIVYGFFEQAEATFDKMDAALYVSNLHSSSHVTPSHIHGAVPPTLTDPSRKDRDLPTLSSLGHFLKGSSATLGLSKVKDLCEKIQHYGARKDEAGNSVNMDDAHFLGLVERTMKDVKSDYVAAEKVLKAFFEGGK